MRWPFITRARHIEAMAALQIELADVKARLLAAETERDRFRGYYERLADDTLMKHGDASAPIHDQKERPSLARAISRSFSLVGNATGAPITGPASDAATHSTRRP